MVYLVIFNGSKYGIESVYAKNWLDFIDTLNHLVQQYGFPPDIIYLKDSRL